MKLNLRKLIRQPPPAPATDHTPISQRFRDAWPAIAASAWNLLGHSETISPTLTDGDGDRLGLPRVRLWDDNQVRPNSLTLYETPETEVVWVVREATWEQGKDEHRLMDLCRSHEAHSPLAPTISIQDAWVPRKEITQLLEKATTLTLPLVPVSALDGTPTDIATRGVDFCSKEDPLSRFSLEWSDLIPEEWNPVLKWLTKVHALLVTCLNHPNCRISR